MFLRFYLSNSIFLHSSLVHRNQGFMVVEFGHNETTVGLIFVLRFFLVSPQWQRYQQHGHPLPVVCPDLSVWLRLPRTAAQLWTQASQTALTPAGEAHRIAGIQKISRSSSSSSSSVFDMKKCASGGRCLNLFFYTVSINKVLKWRWHYKLSNWISTTSCVVMMDTHLLFIP